MDGFVGLNDNLKKIFFVIKKYFKKIEKYIKLKKIINILKMTY